MNCLRSADVVGGKLAGRGTDGDAGESEKTCELLLGWISGKIGEEWLNSKNKRSSKHFSENTGSLACPEREGRAGK